MSLGYTGTCQKVAEDEHIIIYSYSGENWNDGGKSKRGDSQLLDGMFTIQKGLFCTDLERCIQAGIIKIDHECKNAFRRPGVSCDYIAWRLLIHIFDHYKTNSHFPLKELFIQ